MTEPFAPEVDVICEDPRWQAAGLEDLAPRAVSATLAWLGLDGDEIVVAVLGCDDARIAGLNAEFRGKPAPTNVLSWPSEPRDPLEPGAKPAPPTDPEVGDIAIAYETCVREAAAQGKPIANHVLHLICHALLHLLGYDHVHDADAERMEATERDVLASLGVSDPYEPITGADDTGPD